MSVTVVRAIGVLFLVTFLLPTAKPLREIALRSGGVEGSFRHEGARIALTGTSFDMRFQSVGRSERRALPSGSPEALAGEVRYSRGIGITEWWRDVTGGLEHGLTLDARPEGAGPLNVAVEIDGALHVASASGDRAVLADASGSTVASYSGLVVLDASGASVPAAMRLVDGDIVIGIDDADARYPLIIDPLVAIEEANLVLPTREANDAFGSSIAVDATATRAVVGARNDDTSAGTDSGSARVYVRSGTAWVEEAELVPTVIGPNQFFGGAVAMSADGLRVAVGRAGYDAAPVGNYEGGFVVFVRAAGGTTWAEEAAVSGPPVTGGAVWPGTLSITSDGSRLLASAPDYITSWGHAIVYRRMGSAWSLDQELSVPVPAGGTYWGYASGISGDGTRLALSLPGDDAGPFGTNGGSVWIYRLVAGTWTFEARNYASSAPRSVSFGGSANGIALSTDASTMIVGSHLDGLTGSSARGSATIFTRSGTTWLEETVLIPPSAIDGDYAGFAVSLSADGSRALLGMPRDGVAFGGSHGSAQLFDRVGTTWTHAAGFSASTPINGGQFGYTVALAGDGARAAVGSPLEAAGAGVIGYAGSVRVIRLVNRDANGAPCTTSDTCQSGFCVDGVCCDSACGGGATDDCEACSLSAGGVVAGTCGALTAAAAPTVTCRPAAGPCDSAETCTSATNTCPTNAVLPITTECRPSAGSCDVPDACDGVSPACTADVTRPTGFVCRAALGVCDLDETCDGATGACPTDAFAAAGTACRPTAGACDVAESCSGLAGTCPADGFAADGTACGAGSVCDGADACMTGVCTSGTPPDCDDGDDCTADACDASTGCSNTAIADCCNLAVDCDDGDPCTDDVCSGAGGTCTSTAIAGCEDAGVTDGGSDAGTGAGRKHAEDGCACAAAGTEGRRDAITLFAFAVLSSFAVRRRPRCPRNLAWPKARRR